MSLFGLSKNATLKAAIKQIAEARKSEGGKAEQLYKGAYQGFAKVVAGEVTTAEALYNWGFGLLHEAKTKEAEAAKTLLLDAINKFTFCLLAAPSHLGGAIDGGVAYMELARIGDAAIDDPLYDKAVEFFQKAGEIQRGSAAYNLACVHALRNDKEACLKALEEARESGSLPDEEDVMNDPDMASVKDAQWFQEFLGEVAVKLAELAENDRRTRRGLRENVEEIKLDLPPRPTDATLRRHYDAMVAAEVEAQKELLAQKKRDEEEARAKKKKGDQFNYYK